MVGYPLRLVSKPAQPFAFPASRSTMALEEDVLDLAERRGVAYDKESVLRHASTRWQLPRAGGQLQTSARQILGQILAKRQNRRRAGAPPNRPALHVRIAMKQQIKAHAHRKLEWAAARRSGFGYQSPAVLNANKLRSEPCTSSARVHYWPRLVRGIVDACALQLTQDFVWQHLVGRG